MEMFSPKLGYNKYIWKNYVKLGKGVRYLQSSVKSLLNKICLDFRFRSDESKRRGGFKAQYSCKTKSREGSVPRMSLTFKYPFQFVLQKLLPACAFDNIVSPVFQTFGLLLIRPVTKLCQVAMFKPIT